MLPQLPQELIDAITDHLHYDKASLSQCSLVRRAWTHRSHYHLFHTMNLIITTAEEEPEGHALIAFLDDSPHIRGFIKELNVQDPLGPRFATTFCFHQLQAILPRVPSISCITLDSVDIICTPLHSHCTYSGYAFTGDSNIKFISIHFKDYLLVLIATRPG